ncbi:MAG: hypothetical protein EB127_07335 [Alphaproteobacteria bacterium]|nr:hypothetical protein [Alphaproteobacteria bacterium]
MINYIDIKNQHILYWLFKAENMDLSGTHIMRYKGFLETDDFNKFKDMSTSVEYLNKRLLTPEHCKIEFACNKLIGESEGVSYLLKNLKTLLNYTEFYTSGCDPQGFVGWHSDSDINGYYISFVYQGETNGVLKYRDPKSEMVVDFVNTPGWNIFSYQLGNNASDTLWHASHSDSKRFSILIKFKTDEELHQAIKILETEK